MPILHKLINILRSITRYKPIPEQTYYCEQIIKTNTTHTGCAINNHLPTQ